jgi:hypothetical protein
MTCLAESFTTVSLLVWEISDVGPAWFSRNSVLLVFTSQSVDKIGRTVRTIGQLL